jgi:hypothetical protein
MINATDGELVFRKSGSDLQADVRHTMNIVARGLLKLHDSESLDLSKVNSKTHIPLLYSKFVLTHILLQKVLFDQSYVECVWEYYRTRAKDVTAEQFYAVTLSRPGTKLSFGNAHSRGIRRGLGLFLLGLHCQGAITLPMQFDWPPGLKKSGFWDQDLGLYSELVSFLRSLDPDTEQLAHPSFRSVGTTQKRKEWFLCYGTKLLLATGWLTPHDARKEDLQALKRARTSQQNEAVLFSASALIDVFRERYGDAFPITVHDWAEEIRLISAKKGSASWQKLNAAFGGVDSADNDLLLEIIKAIPSMASSETLRERARLPGLEIDLMTLASKWLDLQDIYIKSTKKESYGGARRAIGYLNIYLFYYLPFWFQRRPDTSLEFPDLPEKLRPSIFISRLIKDTKEDLPITFIEYLEAHAKHRKWVTQTHYSVLKQVGVFFEFLEQYRDDLPGCVNFRQIIPDYAYPPNPRIKGTNKRPIPRRIFGLFLDYVEALKAHLEVILEKTLSGDLDGAELGRKVHRTGLCVIDTFATSDLVGFIPIIFTKGNAIPLQFIPNCLNLQWYPVAGGLRKKLPQPHAINQILVALYTGLRHNHIQWLDVRHFDARVSDDAKDFALLHVNTDKSMRQEWTPYVNIRVIEVLRDQRKWRNLIKYPGFDKLCFYNNNPNTKWPPILPLFSSDALGRPHSDGRYDSVWRDILCSIEGLLPSIGESSLRRLLSLEPPGVVMDDSALEAKRYAYGDKCKKVCELKVQTKITPHSARVSVVSQYSPLLPAEIIGSYISGQRPGVVYHYVVLEEQDLRDAQVLQGMRLREQAYSTRSGSLGQATLNPEKFIQADEVNSNLSKSLRKDLQETLISYGCISITLNEGETSGLDVLRETRAANAAENKTEICPYGNHCPPEIIKQWRGVQRCGLCQYAVRSIDHLPAVSAKVKQFCEMLEDLTDKMEQALNSITPIYTDDEFDRLDEERSRIAEELTGWRLNEEVLDAARIRIASGQDDRRWLVQKPEIILKDLQRVRVPSDLTAYVITRLGECITYPTCESPQIRARFDIMRRTLLARKGLMRRAFDLAVPANPAAECAGLLRTLVESNGLGYEDIVKLLEGEGHLDSFTSTPNQLLIEGEST